MDKSPASVIREEIRSIAAYHVPDSTGMVKLDAMENPYGLPSDLAQEVGRLTTQASLNRYPDPTARALKVRLRQAMQIPDAMEILLGNGSDELIQILALAVNKPGAVLLGVEPSFVMFRMIATFVGLRYVSVPLTADFGLDLPALQEAIRVHRPALTFLAYPNNPTGNLFDAAAVERVAELISWTGGGRRGLSRFRGQKLSAAARSLSQSAGDANSLEAGPGGPAPGSVDRSGRVANGVGQAAFAL